MRSSAKLFVLLFPEAYLYPPCPPDPLTVLLILVCLCFLSATKVSALPEELRAPRSAGRHSAHTQPSSSCQHHPSSQGRRQAGGRSGQQAVVVLEWPQGIHWQVWGQCLPSLWDKGQSRPSWESPRCHASLGSRAQLLDTPSLTVMHGSHSPSPSSAPSSHSQVILRTSSTDWRSCLFLKSNFPQSCVLLR